MPRDTLNLLYNVMVLPYFDYSTMVYYCASQTSKLILQKLQTRGYRQGQTNLCLVLGLERAEILCLKNLSGCICKIEDMSQVSYGLSAEMPWNLNI